MSATTKGTSSGHLAKRPATIGSCSALGGFEARPSLDLWDFEIGLPLPGAESRPVVAHVWRIDHDLGFRHARELHRSPAEEGDALCRYDVAATEGHTVRTGYIRCFAHWCGGHLIACIPGLVQGMVIVPGRRQVQGLMLNTADGRRDVGLLGGDDDHRL